MTTILNHHFRTNMTDLRKKRCLSQTELAKAIAQQGHRFHQPTVQRIETGERPIRLDEAVSIASILGVDLAVMMAEPGTQSRPAYAIRHELTVLEISYDRDRSAMSDKYERRRAELTAELAAVEKNAS